MKNIFKLKGEIVSIESKSNDSKTSERVGIFSLKIYCILD